MTGAYPYDEGDVTVLGPEIFAARDGAVICWKGQNYVPMPDPDAPAPDPATWSCKVGEVDRARLDKWDGPMRDAVRDAYVALTGKEPDFIFSGWGEGLAERERAVVEDREPRGPMGSA